MKKNYFLISIFCFSLLSVSLKAQIPDYKERTLGPSKDSINFNQGFNLEATEGSIDPDEYIVGPGDKIFISISGIEDINLNLAVNQEGALFIPKVGGIDLRKTTLSGAKSKISSAINKYYKNVDVFISLFDFRKIKVSLIGDVKKPASIVLPGNSRLIDLIQNSAGLEVKSNYRNIKIISRDNDTAYYDLLAFTFWGPEKKPPASRR